MVTMILLFFENVSWLCHCVFFFFFFFFLAFSRFLKRCANYVNSIFVSEALVLLFPDFCSEFLRFLAFFVMCYLFLSGILRVLSDSRFCFLYLFACFLHLLSNWFHRFFPSLLTLVRRCVHPAWCRTALLDPGVTMLIDSS